MIFRAIKSRPFHLSAFVAELRRRASASPRPAGFKQVLRGLNDSIIALKTVPLSRCLSRKLSRWFVIAFSGLG